MDVFINTQLCMCARTPDFYAALNAVRDTTDKNKDS